MFNRKWFLATVMMLLVSLLLVACSNEESSSDVEQVLKIANDQEPAGLDPHKTPAHSSVRIYSQVYSGLVAFNENMEIVGDLASEWEQPDNQTYIFKLREGVTFHNGSEVTAEDVKYSFERIMAEETASHIASYFSNVESIEVLGEYEVQFNLSSPDATFLSNLTNASAAIVDQEVVEENGDLQQVAVGTGPFKFVEWVPDNRVSLVKNEDYFIDGQPKLDEVIYYTMKEESARLSAIRTGEVDMTTLTAQSASLIEGEEAIDIKSYQSLEYSYVGFNVNSEPLNNQKVRQALSLATNRESVADIVWNGDAVVSGPVAPSMGDWAIDVGSHELYQNDIEKAKSLLEEAGYPDGFEITITTASTYADMVDTAQVLQQQWEEIGVNADIKQIEWGEYIDTWSNTSADILIGRNGSGTDPDRALNYFFHTDGSANVWGFSDSEYDALVEQGVVTVDQAERQEIYNEAQNLLLDLSPNLFLVSPMKYVAVRDSVVDFTPYPHDGEDIVEVSKQ
ncbi:ABC transporter substrate-binding protein [Tenuibacillus multivorans]|uniref:Peptide/nickel transport system substrate-binding protein n=1 Tax=Tenuibacillus multivorans TaxID=237069 RepID=A0A1H0C4S5_9BACI|nr:ABC transporter substrate-binding protein [Tenuibacillus multivorans]GEL77765.1 ABC transporter substrate-binding protein [Tenuibacillus multivorans]SDN52860.1 peptide/nickel transport system substrate-binding protein [Tenuibacillus multivorans]